MGGFVFAGAGRLAEGLLGNLISGRASPWPSKVTLNFLFCRVFRTFGSFVTSKIHDAEFSVLFVVLAEIMRVGVFTVILALKPSRTGFNLSIISGLSIRATSAPGTGILLRT